MTASGRLAELGIELPPVAKPVAAYVPAVEAGGLVVTSGQLPSIAGRLVAVGRVGAEVSPEDAAAAARTAVLNALAAASDVVGGIDRIGRIVKVVVYVASAPDFTGQPLVYRPEADGFVLYSLGKNFRDDNGTIESIDSRRSDTCDIVWRSSN